MSESLKAFRADLAKAVLDVLWPAWSRVGVMGSAAGRDRRIIDPEPLLLLTWECARQAPRVFDEVLDWLARNGRWINTGRLATLLQEDRVCSPSIAGAVARIMTRHDKTPKWRKLAEVPKFEAEPTAFFERVGKPLEPAGELDSAFLEHGWRRSRVELRGQSQAIPVWRPESLVFKCRAFFGVSIRADVFAWLVANGSGTASHLARELGYSQRRVHEALMEMQFAEAFQIRREANRKEYVLEPGKGWRLLFEAPAQTGGWFNWRAFGRAVSVVWRKAFGMREADLTEYVLESELRKAIEQAKPDFTACGVGLSARPAGAELMEKLRMLAAA